MYKSKYLEKINQRRLMDALYQPIEHIDMPEKVEIKPGGDNSVRDADGNRVSPKFINSAQIHRTTFPVTGATTAGFCYSTAALSTGISLKGRE